MAEDMSEAECSTRVVRVLIGTGMGGRSVASVRGAGMNQESIREAAASAQVPRKQITTRREWFDSTQSETGL